MEICYNIKLKTALACLLLLSGAFAFAQTETEGIEGVHTKKDAVMDDSTHGHITLNTYVEGEVKVKTQSVPCDIVMVLDFSESMKGSITQLKESCKAFLQTIRDNSSKNNVQHRVAIVTYNTYKLTAMLQMSTDGTVVWPQKYDARTTLNGYDPYGVYKGGSNNLSRKKNANQDIDNYVRNTLKSFFIPVDANLDGYGNVPEYIISQFTETDFGDEGNSYRGLYTAEELLNVKRSAAEKEYVKSDGTKDVKPTFVVLFTDDAPGFESQTELTFSDENKSICFAINAIAESNRMKKNGTRIFTIAMNSKCSPSSINSLSLEYVGGMNQYTYYKDGVSAFNCYMHLISSNYEGNNYTDELNLNTYFGYNNSQRVEKVIGPQMMDIWNNAIGKSDVFSKGTHYLAAMDPSGLEAAFEKISEMIIEELPSMPLSSETVLKDYIDGRYFSLPEGATPETIQVYTHNCIGGTKVGDTYTEFEFDKIDAPVDRVVVTVETDTESYNNLISVKGFDYAANWVGLDTQGKWRGKELVVVIPFVIKEGVDVSGTLQTNTGDSGIYLPGSDEPLKPYPIPEIVYWNLNIKRTFLEKGESAVYSVYIRKEGDSSWPAKPNYIINLTAGTTGPVERTIVDAPVIQNDVYNEFKVVETGWSWAYESTNTDSEHAQVKKYDPDRKELNFEFTGGHKDITDTNKASYKLNHNESIKTSTFKINNK